MANYYNNIETEKIINSPQFTETFNDVYYIDGEITEEKLNDLDIYYVDNALMKNYTMSIDGKPTIVQWRMYTQKITGEDRYTVKPRGVALDEQMDIFIQNVSTAFGYKVDPITKEEIIEDVINRYTGADINLEKSVVNGFIDLYGRSSYDYSIVDIIRNYFEQFPNIDNPYEIVYKPLPQGENFITIYDHNNFINNQVGAEISTATTPKQLKTAFDNLMETNEDFRNIISNSQVVGFGYNHITPTTTRMYVNGYTLDNAKVVASDEGENKQYYSSIVTEVKGGYWSINTDYGDLLFHQEGGLWERSGLSASVTFYNYPKSLPRDIYGLNIAGAINAIWYYSVGSSTVGNSITSFSDNHSTWYSPTDPYVPVGGIPMPGSEPTIETQTIIRDGVPPIKIIPPNPIEGVTPYPDVDEPSPPTLEDDVPNASWGMGNIYHPTNEELDKFYEWIWDRDTWHEKQELNANPLEAVISCHTLPLPQYVYLPKTGGSSEWVTRSWYDSDPIDVSLGFMTAKDMSSDDNLQSARVPYRYAKYSFGYVDIPRTYRDYRDFDREIYIFLPYIGFRQLRCDDVTAYKGYLSTRVYLDYVVDISTGDFVAEISIDRNTADRKLLYTFNGNMATVLPISATDKTALSSIRWSAIGKIGASALSGAIAAGSLYFSGGTLTPIAGGALASAVANLYSAGKDAIRKGTDNTVAIQRSDSLSGSFGAMTPRTPYIVVTSNIAYDTNYAPFSGDSANVTIQLGLLKGFTQCKYVHVDTLNYITEEERKEIESILTSGVIL